MSAPPSANDMLTGKASAGGNGRAAPATQNSDLALMKIMWDRLGWSPPFEHITDIERNVTARYESQRHNPKVVPPGRDKPLIYYSPTKTSQMPDGERWALINWKLRQAAKGVAMDHGIQDAILAVQEDDEAVDRLVQQAMTRAKADQSAQQGTARHKVAEKIDFGIEPGPLSPRVKADIDAYRAVTHGLDMALAEVFVVYDQDKMGGTLDRVAYYPVTGRYHIVDLKPPDSGFGQGERAIQFGIYSRSQPYNWNLAQHLLATDRKALKTATLRTELPQPLDLEQAIMVHVPRGGGRAFTAWVDIDQGWTEGFDIARRMRRWQNRDFQEGLVRPFEVKAPPTVIDVATRRTERPPTTPAPGHTTGESQRGSAGGGTPTERSPESVERVAQLAGATPFRERGLIDSRPVTDVALPAEDPTDPLNPDAAVFDAIERAVDLTALKAVYAQYKATWTQQMTTAYKARRDKITGEPEGKPA